MDIKIIYEDSDVLVIDKPAGLIVHEDGITTEETVVDWFLKKCPDAKGVGEEGKSSKGVVLERSGIVHRLDRDTSGVLILAKTAEAFVHLKAQFHDRLVKKEYRAFVYGPVREPWGTIDRPIGRSTRDFRLRSAERGSKGLRRDAVTDWELIGTGRFQNEHFSYLKLSPKTGRTHQLRVHLKAIGKPIVQDALYAAHLIADSNNLALSRLALHAHHLEVTLPNGERERFMAPVPLEFDVAAERLSEESVA